MYSEQYIAITVKELCEYNIRVFCGVSGMWLEGRKEGVKKGC